MQASTYISFFSTSAGKSPADPHITHQLLHAITVDTTFLLGYVTPNTSTELSPIKQLLDLAKTLLDKRATWITDLSRDINQDGNMYPHSLVSHWADGLASRTVQRRARVGHWPPHDGLSLGPERPSCHLELIDTSAT